MWREIAERMSACTSYVAVTRLTLLIAPSLGNSAILLGAASTFFMAKAFPPLQDVCALFTAQAMSTGLVMPQEITDGNALCAPFVVLLYLGIISFTGWMLARSAVMGDVFEQYLSLFSTRQALLCLKDMPPNVLFAAATVYLALPSSSTTFSSSASWSQCVTRAVSNLMARAWADRCLAYCMPYDLSLCALYTLLLAPFAAPDTKRGQCHAILSLLCAQRVVEWMRRLVQWPWALIALGLVAFYAPSRRLADTCICSAGLLLADVFQTWLEQDMSRAEAVCAYFYVFVLLAWVRRQEEGEGDGDPSASSSSAKNNNNNNSHYTMLMVLDNPSIE